MKHIKLLFRRIHNGLNRISDEHPNASLAISFAAMIFDAATFLLLYIEHSL